ncbi:MAG TPA: hypothetical protein VJ180_01595 [Pyrinomonadaceae bacterium]|nr:hypothetical protein [Pyrinomonadaceae bacterium]
MKRLRMSRVISFRVTEEEWLDIEKAAAANGNKPHEWCRKITLETAQLPEALTPYQRFLFGNFARVRFLVENGFQLLADDTLESEEWERFRAFARANLDVITNRALADFDRG